MRTSNFLKSTLVAAVLSCAAGAHASILNFDFTGDYTAHFQLDSQDTPIIAVENRFIQYYPVSGDFALSTDNTVEVDFYSANDSGGFAIADYRNNQTLAAAFGDQVYVAGTELLPVFTLGTYHFIDGALNYNLTISDADAGTGSGDVPEPASAALMLGGLGLMFAATKRRLGK